MRSEGYGSRFMYVCVCVSYILTIQVTGQWNNNILENKKAK